MLFKLIVLFIILQIVVALGMLVADEYIKYLLTQHMLNATKTQTYVILLLSEAFSVQVVILYYCGLPVASKCNRDIYTSHLGSLLKLWVVLGFGCCFQGACFASTLYKLSNSLQDLMEMDLLRGLEEYYFNAEWRLIWDNMQYHEKCCGVYDFTDWKSRYDDKMGKLEQLSVIPTILTCISTHLADATLMISDFHHRYRLSRTAAAATKLLVFKISLRYC